MCLCLVWFVWFGFVRGSMVCNNSCTVCFVVFLFACLFVFGFIYDTIAFVGDVKIHEIKNKNRNNKKMVEFFTFPTICKPLLDIDHALHSFSISNDVSLDPVTARLKHSLQTCFEEPNNPPVKSIYIKTYISLISYLFFSLPRFVVIIYFMIIIMIIYFVSYI